MIRYTFPVGPLECNCTILGCEKTGEACVIDPGDQGEIICEHLRRLSLKPKYLLHTHAHFDHVGATRPVKEKAGGEILLHEDDRWLYDGLVLQGEIFGALLTEPLPLDSTIEEGDELTVGTLRIRVMHTPGHTPGSCCFQLLNEDGALFSGDTLFAGSIGRTDLPGGDMRAIMRSLEKQLLPLDDEIPVIPGHGPPTTIGKERRLNPFLKDL